MSPRPGGLLPFPRGTRLRVELALKPVLRETIGHASQDAAAWLKAIDGAKLSVTSRTDDGFKLHCETATGSARLYLRRQADGRFEMSGDSAVGPQRVFDLTGLCIQCGTSDDIYFAQWSAGELRHLACVRHEPAAAVTIYMFSAALSSFLAPVWRTLLPSQTPQ